MLFNTSLSSRARKARRMIAGGIALAAVAGIVLAQATPALADPTEVLVAVGADSTQDVYNQFALNAAGNLVGSWNATNPVTGATHEVITPVDGSAGNTNCSFPRPLGSDEGVADLRMAMMAGPLHGCVDIARSTTGPSQSLQSPTGSLVYIPFAVDGVAMSTGPADVTSCPTYDPCPAFSVATPANGTVSVSPVNTLITTADQFTQADLQAMYENCQPVTEGGVTYDPTGTIGNDTKIDLYVPQPGSDSRAFLGTLLSFNTTTLPSCVHDHIVGGVLAADNVPVAADDGTAVVSDPNGFAPYNIPQWISQRNGHNDRRHGAVLHSVGSVSPFAGGQAATGGLNTGFPFTRDDYSVVSFARVTNSADPLDQLLNGSSSFVCKQQVALVQYGFGLLSTCGEVIAALRSN